ncbi:MAG: NAD(P)/FAD-dependent oxidoreductase [Steroidobacteraceae bacterium]
MTQIVIVGAGFAGLAAARTLANRAGVEVTLLDRSNHHLFQPLLYQVATAALSPADISAPVRSILRRAHNVQVLMADAQRIDLAARRVDTDAGPFAGDYLVIGAGATHAYFGHDAWEPHAPGLKTLPHATAMRARILLAFEQAERCADWALQQAWLNFVVVGGGPTGVEMAGAIAEMSRHTLARDFRRIDPRKARVLLVEAGPRLLPAFTERSSARARRDLAALGVDVRLGAAVTDVTASAVTIDAERVATRTVVWAAGVRASPLAQSLGVPLDRAGRVPVTAGITIAGHERVFVTGDLAASTDPVSQRPLPGVAQVAIQQGRYAAECILADQRGAPRAIFRYRDKGQMATIGRQRAICEIGRFTFGGRLAWWLWLLVHIMGLTSFRSRASVLLQWGWSFFTYGRGARLIVAGKDA